MRHRHLRHLQGQGRIRRNRLGLGTGARPFLHEGRKAGIPDVPGPRQRRVHHLRAGQAAARQEARDPARLPQGYDRQGRAADPRRRRLHAGTGLAGRFRGRPVRGARGRRRHRRARLFNGELRARHPNARLRRQEETRREILRLAVRGRHRRPRARHVRWGGRRSIPRKARTCCASAAARASPA